MRFDVFTLFPDVFPGYLDASILFRAREMGLLEVEIHNIRDWTFDKHQVTDEPPYGGGGGMVMKPEPIFAAVEDLLGQPESGDVDIRRSANEREMRQHDQRHHQRKAHIAPVTN